MTHDPPTEPPVPHHAVNIHSPGSSSPAAARFVDIPEDGQERAARFKAADRFAKSQLRAIVERIENIEVEKAQIGEDIKEVYAEAKGNGFDVKALRTVIRLRAMDKAEREESEAILDTYLNALGML